MSYVKTNWVNGETPINATNLNNIENGIDALGGLSGEILWTNSSPSSSFSSRTITLSSSDYDVLEVFFKPIYNQNVCVSTRMIKGNGGVMMITTTEYSAITMFLREITRSNDTSFTIGNGYAIGTAKLQNNNVCVPLYIVGYKTGLFS